MAKDKENPAEALVDPKDLSATPPASSTPEDGRFKRRSARLYNVEPEGLDTAEVPTPKPRRRGVAKKEAQPTPKTPSPAKRRRRASSQAKSKTTEPSTGKKAKSLGKGAAARSVAAPGETNASTSNASTSNASQSESKARSIVKRYARWAAGVGVVPVLVFDLVAMPVLLVNMLREMAGLYDIEFSQQRTKIYVTSLLGFIAPASALTTLGRVFRFSTGAGFILGPAAAWATTWAVGEVFIRHFELGGTLLDFDAEAMRGEVEKRVAAGGEKERTS